MEFNTSSGLPSNHVYEVIETENGTPWAFTESGIAWYDGYVWNPVVFPTAAPLSKPNSLYADSRNRIVITHDSTLTIGDERGFTKQDIRNVVHAVPLPEGDVLVLRGKENGLQRVDRWDGRSVIPCRLPERIDARATMHLVRTRSGTIWLGSEKHWFMYESGRWKSKFSIDPLGDMWWPDALAENRSNSGIAFGYGTDRSLKLWEWSQGTEPLPVLNREYVTERAIASDISDGGMALTAHIGGFYYVRYNREWSILRLEGTWGRRVESLRFRRNGDIWFCTDRGLFLCKYSSERWRSIYVKKSWPRGSINEILLSSDRSLWLGTGSDLRVHKRNGAVDSITTIRGHNVRPVTGVIEAPDSSIWVCSGSGFTGAFRLKRSKWEMVGRGTPLAGAYIHRMRVDRRGRIWLLGLPGKNPSPGEEGPGAFVYENGSITQWTLPSNRVYAFGEGSDGSLWFGTFSGLSRFKAGVWTHWSRKDLFLATRVFTLAVDKENRVWFSDTQGIVGVIDTNDVPRRIKIDDGLINEQVWELKVDAKGRLWCTSPAGLAVYVDGSWLHLDEELGLRLGLFWPVLPLEDEVYVGSLSGLDVLRISDIEQPAPRLYLDESFTTEDMALLHWRAFSAWGEIPPSLMQTRYRIGKQKWSHWSHILEAKVQGLAPGDYSYEVQSKPLLGDDSTSYRTVQGTFTIAVPMRKDPRYVIPAAIAGLVIVTLFLGLTSHARRLRQRQLNEELRREREQAGRIAEVDRMKSHFFANVSHEFRTPLTLVLGPIKQALSHTADDWTREKLSLAHRNAEKLQVLINQLLDFSKIEAGTMKLAVSRGDIVLFVKRIVGSFQSWAEQNNITMKCQADIEKLEGYFDGSCVDKILNNLISNALKFTLERGMVTVTIVPCSIPGERDRKGVRISVVDNGIGIGSEHLPHLFERFYRVDNSHRTEGTGIGLAIAKELVDLHHGTINVRSTPGQGTEFTVTLPLESFSANEIFEGTDNEIRQVPKLLPLEISEAKPKSEEAFNEHQTIVLIVEDNADMRGYIREYLVPEFTVLEARDGVEGIEKARAAVPDLVVSDIMMPSMDGHELCRELKHDERTSHIPIILLTARSAKENKIEGLELGADDYLTKPFDAQELLARVRNLIENRRKLREKFGKTVPISFGEVTERSLDDAFLQKAVDIVNAHIGDEDFTIEQFSNEIGLSRMQLHRKILALTSHSASVFVRQMRLLRAHELLVKKAGTISEIAYQNGFSSPNYFTRCYHEQYGCTPTETLERTSSRS